MANTFFPCSRSCVLLCTTFAFEKQLTEWQILEKSLQLSSHLDEAPGFHFRSARRNRHKYTINLAGIYRTITQKQTKRKKSRLKALLVGMEFFLNFLSMIIWVPTFPVMIIVVITRASYVTIPEDTAWLYLLYQTIVGLHRPVNKFKTFLKVEIHFL